MKIQELLTSNNSTLSERIEDGTLYLSILIFIFMILFQLAIFPFYVYVNKVNRQRDSVTIIYPILKHFYEMVKRVYLLLFLLICSTCFMIYCFMKSGKNAVFYSYMSLIPFFIIPVCYVCLQAIVQVFQFLIFLLALKKSCLYFFPATEGCIASFQRVLLQKIQFFYIFFLLKEITQCLSFFICIVPSISCYEGMKFRVEFIRLLSFFSLNILLFASALLYIPILVSIAKFSHLPSAKLSTPEKFIWWQILTTLLLKLIGLPCFIIVCNTSMFASICLVTTIDVITTPLIIQLSYLGCNRRNIDVILRSCKFTQFVKVLVKDGTQENQVEPTQTDSFT
ncbi:hypothetical protein CAEBREN_04736 [Caenorhabditis brenneri]|uniref:Serpentine Receptor, class Z n=1 Tax=Caenorhabditis brenneri TaxID=135651 RepID=G0PE91_CAEBE|nr:hypothetical protein CAEBREN_04736 [Caenorhabditis brenneri]